MKKSNLKSNDYFKLSNVIDISAIAIFGLGALTFIASVPTALAYACLAGRYSGEIKASAEYDEFTSEKLAEYQVAFNNGEMSKSEYLKKVDELDRGNIFSEFMKERATDEQVATYNDFDNKAVTAVSIMSSSVAVIGLCAILCKISENLSKKGRKLREKENENQGDSQESQSDFIEV